MKGFTEGEIFSRIMSIISSMAGFIGCSDSVVNNYDMCHGVSSHKTEIPSY